MGTRNKNTTTSSTYVHDPALPIVKAALSVVRTATPNATAYGPSVEVRLSTPGGVDFTIDMDYDFGQSSYKLDTDYTVEWVSTSAAVIQTIRDLLAKTRGMYISLVVLTYLLQSDPDAAGEIPPGFKRLDKLELFPGNQRVSSQNQRARQNRARDVSNLIRYAPRGGESGTIASFPGGAEYRRAAASFSTAQYRESRAGSKKRKHPQRGRLW